MAQRSQKRFWSLALAVGLALVAAPAAHALRGQPTFQAALWGDGAMWGTKGAAPLPAPNAHNVQSFDMLFVFTNSPMQMPVAEAAPGNPAFNGGRWFTHTVAWTDEALDTYDPLPILTSYDDILMYWDELVIEPGPPPGVPAYFECPLLPVK